MWARVAAVVDEARVVDVVLVAVDTVVVVYVMRGAFACRHLLAEARRHLAYALRGRRHEPGLEERIVQAALDNCTRPVGHGRRTTADLRALYPRDTEDQAVLRPLARKRTAPQYENRDEVPVPVLTRGGCMGQESRRDGRGTSMPQGALTRA
ncbi:hypothetical protein GCM10017752_00210 [Streptomyces roseoviridis]